MLRFLVDALCLKEFMLNFFVHSKQTFLVILNFLNDVIVALTGDVRAFMHETPRDDSLSVWNTTRVQVGDPIVFDFVGTRLAHNELLLHFEIGNLRVLMFGFQFFDQLILIFDRLQLHIDF